jgi:hypothetical protein
LKHSRKAKFHYHSHKSRHWGVSWFSLIPPAIVQPVYVKSILISSSHLFLVYQVSSSLSNFVNIILTFWCRFEHSEYCQWIIQLWLLFCCYVYKLKLCYTTRNNCQIFVIPIQTFVDRQFHGVVLCRSHQTRFVRISHTKLFVCIACRVIGIWQIPIVV